MTFNRLVKNALYLMSVSLATAACKTTDLEKSSTLATGDASDSQYRICATEVSLRDNNHEFVKLLQINNVVSLEGDKKVVEDNTFVRISLNNQNEYGWVAEQFIVQGKCNHPALSLPIILGRPICEYSWEEKKGTTDYRVYDNYRRTNYHAPDRAESQTLVGSGVQATKSRCEKARFLQPCFSRAVAKASGTLETKFLDWARSKGYKPETVLMAIAEQETKLGHLRDQGSNGVGLTQIVTAFKTKNSLVADNDHAAWAGITHNILTNLKYSMRAAGVKIMENRVSNISDLGYYYNGSPAHQNTYARNVEAFYNQFRGCGL